MIVFSMDDTRSAEPPGRARARRGRGPETSGIPVTRIVEAQFCRVVTGGNHRTDRCVEVGVAFVSFVARAAEIYLPVSRRILPDASFNA
jgi:hypothetical protein